MVHTSNIAQIFIKIDKILSDAGLPYNKQVPLGLQFEHDLQQGCMTLVQNGSKFRLIGVTFDSELGEAIPLMYHCNKSMLPVKEIINSTQLNTNHVDHSLLCRMCAQKITTICI